MKQEFKNLIKGNKTLYTFLLRILKIGRRRKRKSFFDYLFSNVVGGNIKVEVKNIPGEFRMDARSHILERILITKAYEPEIVNEIVKNIDPSKDAINIGANIGLITNLLAGIINESCKVLAIEPTPNAFKYLTENIEYNRNGPKVITYHGVVTDKSGEYVINVITGKEEYSSLGKLVHPSTKDMEFCCVDVNGETIDNLVNKYNLNAGIIVMDVEGAEYSVLNGAISTIIEFKPAIILEVDDKLLREQNSNSKQIISLLESLGYDVEIIGGTEINSQFIGNLIAIPKYIS